MTELNNDPIHIANQFHAREEATPMETTMPDPNGPEALEALFNLPAVVPPAAAFAVPERTVACVACGEALGTPACTCTPEDRHEALEARLAAVAAPAVKDVDADVEEVLDGELLDSAADEHLWPMVLDAKGKPTGELARPNPQALEAAQARTVSVDDVAVLSESVSEAEARDIIGTAASQRGLERGLAHEVARRRAHLAADGARRQAEHDAGRAEARRKRENRLAEALEQRERATDPTTRIVRLALAERIVPWIAVLPALLATLAGAVNVGSQLDVLSPHTFLINWAVEPLLTLPVVAILAAQILGAVPTGGKNPYKRVEAVLIGIAATLNVGLHAVVDGWSPATFVWLFVPFGLAFSTHLVPRLLRSIREALAAQQDTATVPSWSPFSAPAKASPLGWTPGGPAVPAARTEAVLTQVSPAVQADPEYRSEAEILSDFAAALDEGRVDPLTGRAMNPESGESIRRTLRVSKARSAELRDRYKSMA